MPVSVKPALSLVGLLALVGCGASLPAPDAPAQEATVHVVAPVPAAAPTKEGVERGTRSTGEEGEMGDTADARASRAAALRDAAEFGLEGLLSSGTIPTGVFGGGGVGGAILGGSVGGIGLSGVGSGAGGIGLGSIGTIGIGGGGTGYGVGSSSAAYSNPVSGQSVIAGPTSVIEVGDAVTLGLSGEQAMRLVRDRAYRVRDCYEDRLSVRPSLAGSLALRIVVARDGRVVRTLDLGSDLADPATFTCVAKVLEGVQVGIPASGHLGVIETVLRFSRPPKK